MKPRPHGQTPQLQPDRARAFVSGCADRTLLHNNFNCKMNEHRWLPIMLTSIAFDGEDQVTQYASLEESPIINILNIVVVWRYP